MRIGQFQKWLLFISLLCFDVVLFFYLESEIQMRNCFSFETGKAHLVSFDISTEQLMQFYADSDGNLSDFISLLTLYMGTDCLTSDKDALWAKKDLIFRYKKEEYEQLYSYLTTIFQDMVYFPVGEIKNLPTAEYSYVNSWHYARNFNGERVHEGCDIMATYNKRGIYPIYSATDGVIENIGWLKLGGYRIGIRSTSGAYYYYAHLAEYAKDFQPGETIKAGEFIGFMGDTGYSEVVGTTGQFDVHLHFGIYFDDENGKEFAINPYPALYFCEQRQKGTLDEN